MPNLSFCLFRATLLAGGLLLVLLTQPLPLRAAGQEVAYQLDPAHTGSTAQPGFGLPLALKWTAEFEHLVSYPVVAEGRVFVTVADYPSPVKRLLALDLTNGSLLWQHSLGGEFWRTLTCYEAGLVFNIDAGGLMQAFEAATGVRRWSRQFLGGSHFTAAPTALNGIVYTSDGSSLLAVRSSDGLVLWKEGVLGGDSSSPAVTDEGVYVSYAGLQVYKFDPVSGVLRWHHNTGISGGGGRTASYHAGRLYVRSNSFGGRIFDAATGAIIGGFPDGHPPALYGNRMFVASGATLIALDLAGGPDPWTVNTTAPLAYAPIVVNGWVFAATRAGEVYAYDAANGTLQWSVSLAIELLPTLETDRFTVLTGFGAGEGMLLVPAGRRLLAYAGSDSTSPVTTAGTSGPQGSGGWFLGPVSVALTASDVAGSGIAATHFRLDGGVTETYESPITVSGDALHSLIYWSIDRAGNVESSSTLEIRIDGTVPFVTWGAPTPPPNAGGWNNSPVEMAYTASDNLSGVASASPSSPVRLAEEGEGRSASVTVIDVAGNSGVISSPPVNIDTTPAAISAVAKPPVLRRRGPPMRSVIVCGRITDALAGVDAATAQYSVSDEYGRLQPRGTIVLNADGTFSFTLRLQARRGPRDRDGRAYQIVVRGADRAGNDGSSTNTVQIRAATPAGW